ncbi:MAG: DUF4180 domain-containing protein [Oscillospiraceae bacterium]|nr:DUF4180 domain-containing protein [Oscillospiraceae bacterium]
MKFDCIEKNGVKVVIVNSEKMVISDAQSALDLLATVSYDYDSTRIVINKVNIVDAFFVLSTGLAGEVLQKFINYHGKIAIYGDFSRYTSKPLKDFIYESNRGKDVFFVSTKEEAVERLAG